MSKDMGASADADRAIVNVPSARWSVIGDKVFGASVKLVKPDTADMILVCADTPQHQPQFVGLSHHAYVEKLLEIAEQTGARSLTIMPYRNADKVTIDVRDLRDAAAIAHHAQAIEARRAETRSGSVEDESAVGEADAPAPLSNPNNQMPEERK